MRSFIFLLLFLVPAAASPETSLREGDRTAQDLLGKSSKPEHVSHPFFQGIPDEAALRTKPSLEASQTAERMVRESNDSRPRFKLDPASDPLLRGSSSITANPLGIIGGAGTHETHMQYPGKDSFATCEEAGEEGTYTCTSTLHVDVREELGDPQQGGLSLNGQSYRSFSWMLLWVREKKRHFVAHMTTDPATLNSFISGRVGTPIERVVSVSRAEAGEWQNVGHKEYVFAQYHLTYSYRPLVKVPYFSREDQCGALEGRADSGLCSYVSRICTQGPETRVIDGLSVRRDCWEYTSTYTCTHPSQDDCGPLRAKGCVQVNSTCKQHVGNTCVAYTQTYQCQGQPSERYGIRGGNTPFCLDGNCRDQSYELNDEWMSSLAQLILFKEMQGKFDGLLFKGNDNRCSKCPLSFKDCCGTGRGWGVSLRLAGCSGEEQALSLKREKGLCHLIGTYCSRREPLTRVCLQKKSTYCCFGSKLLRLFHVQGRSQIRLGWGSPESPLCRGFTVQELQRIDFARLDLREIFEDLMKSYTPQKREAVSQRLQERLGVLQEGLKSRSCPASFKERGDM